MSKPMLTTIIILAALVLTAGGYLGYKYYWQNRGGTVAVVVETRDFSCPGMTGFTFKYPVFKGWEVKKIDGSTDKCHIWLSTEGLAMAGLDADVGAPPSIIVSKRPVFLNPDPRDHFSPNIVVRTDFKNPNGVYYSKFAELSGVGFYMPISDITYFEIEVLPPSLSQNSFSFFREQFFKTVIESFKIIPAN